MLSGLEGLLPMVGLKMMTESVQTGARSRSWRLKVSDFRSSNAETAGTNEVWTNGTESRLVFDNLRE